MIVGVLLLFLGFGGYIATGGTSLTALIPAVVGALLVGTAFVARAEHLRKHAMHAAAAIGLIGFIGSIGGAVKVFTLLGGGSVERPQAVVAQALMALLCAIYVGLAVRSFIQARILRKS
jgi:hypothetical protein